MLAQEQQALLDTAEWALDLVKMYEARLIELGEPAKLVHSDIQIQGLKHAASVINWWRWEAFRSNGSEPLRWPPD